MPIALHTIRSYKAALFDLDGVVFDTEPGYTRFWEDLLSRYMDNGPEMVRRIKGQTLTQIMEVLFGDRDEDFRKGVVAELDAYERTMPVIYVPGVMEFIEKLRKEGYMTALVTSSNHSKMEAIYRHCPQFRSAFDLILMAEDFSASKPSPECYLKAAERLRLTSDDCIVFEDSFNGLRSGRAAGMYTVGVTTSHPADRLKELSELQIADFSAIEP